MTWPVSFYTQFVLYDRRMAEITAFVLAGGQSSRMGRDKAFIELEGRTLLTSSAARRGLKLTERWSKTSSRTVGRWAESTQRCDLP
jgi:CTP:molybdopterin cytidylyltransferase MocA